VAIIEFFKTLSAFQRVLLGLGLGILTGLFFGEATASLEIIGNAYIKLLQMTVLPYILVSLVLGLARLDVAHARRVGTIGLLLILMLWGITLISVLFLPLAYPDWTTSAFFSTSLVQEPEAFDPLTLYIPSNPFFSMANGVVPAVVVFGILLGSTIIVVPNKHHLLDSLSVLGDGLMRIASIVGKSAPIGIFAISAAAAGTLQVEQLSRLQVFLWSYVAVWIVLAYCTLPLLVAWATPFSYREVFKMSQVPMITALATGTVLVVVPMIAEECKKMLKEKNIKGDQADSMVDLLAPTCYSFPSVGTLLGLGFIMFGAWYVGSPLSVADYPSFVAIGAFVAFGSMPVAIPFMLDYFALPTDLFQLYLLGSVITARLATALAAMHGVAICLLGPAGVVGQLHLRKLGHAILVSITIVAMMTIGLGFTLTHTIPYEYTGEDDFIRRGLVSKPVPIKLIDSPTSLSEVELKRRRLDIIRDRGTLRVGYMPDRLPFAHRNQEGQITGFDLDLMHALARDLEISLEIARIELKNAAAMLDNGQLDIVVGGISVTPERAIKYTFTDSYMNQSIGLVVLDHRRDEFISIDNINELQDLRIDVPGSPYYLSALQSIYPNAELRKIDSPRSFFKQTDADALAYTVEAGSAWSLIYPEYTALMPRGVKLKTPIAFAVPIREPKLLTYLNTWLVLSKTNGTTDKLYRYWILGEDLNGREPRWSIMHNVLGWGN